MALDIFKNKGVPLERQTFTWRDMVRPPISKLNDDAFTLVRVILMNGIECESVRFQHACARMNRPLQRPLARVRRVEQHQQAMVNWFLPPDLSPIETTIGYEQTAVEVTAALAQQEPDPYLASIYRFGLLEDLDHLYRYAALLDRVEGKDPDAVLKNHTDICPGRPAAAAHRAPEDDLRRAYARDSAHPLTKLNALTALAGAFQAHDYYMNVGPLFADPVARQLYAEIASIKEQHVTQYECLADPGETWLEKWLLHEAAEVYNYYGCATQETNPRLKAVWERFVDYELGQLQFVMGIFTETERRDPAEVLPSVLPDPFPHKSHRSFVRDVLAKEADLRARGTELIDKAEEPEDSLSMRYRHKLNEMGSPSEAIAAGYRWRPGTEVAVRAGVGKGQA